MKSGNSGGRENILHPSTSSSQNNFSDKTRQNTVDQTKKILDDGNMDHTIRKHEVYIQNLKILKQIEDAKNIMNGFDQEFQTHVNQTNTKELMKLLRRVDKYLRTVDKNAFKQERALWAYRAKQILALYEQHKPKAIPHPARTPEDAMQILGLTRETLSLPAIKKSYRSLASKYHPDLHPDDKNTETLMTRLNTARDILLKFINKQ